MFFDFVILMDGRHGIKSLRMKQWTKSKRPYHVSSTLKQHINSIIQSHAVTIWNTNLILLNFPRRRRKNALMWCQNIFQLEMWSCEEKTLQFIIHFDYKWISTEIPLLCGRPHHSNIATFRPSSWHPKLWCIVSVVTVWAMLVRIVSIISFVQSLICAILGVCC